MATISNLEIFGAGTHNASTGKVTVSEQDLDAMVDAFAAFQSTNVVKPHLKLGHEESQKWFGQKQGFPSLGWIDKVWRVGKKLFADISDVPEVLVDMIRQGRYHNVSAEVYMDIEHDGKKFSHVLSAVALLGVEMPAVSDLAGLAAALFKTEVNQFSGKVATALTKEVHMFTQEQVDSLIAAAVAKVTGEVEAKSSAEIADLKLKLDVSDKAKLAASAELDTVRAAAAQAEATALVDGAIKDGKLLPKQRDFALAFLSAKDNKIKFGKDEKSSAAMFKDFLEAQGKVLDTTESGSGKNKKVEYSNAADEVDQKAKELVSADTTGKLQYSAAFKKVLSDDPALKDRYSELAN